MKGQAAIMSSARTGEGSDNWCTPDEVLNRVESLCPDGRIALDPCTNILNPTDAHVYCTGLHDEGPGVDGLLEDWTHLASNGITFVNWPYSKGRAWAAKMVMEALKGCRIIALGPARPDTQWWRTLTTAADEVAFWRGRLTFVGAPTCAPFPSALFSFNIGRRAMLRAFGDVADVWSCP